MNQITVTTAKPDEFEAVGVLVSRLLVELFPDEDNYRGSEKYIFAARKLLETGNDVWALVAKTENGEIVGILTLNHCAAIYAGGSFGEISELYGDNSERSFGIGAKLIDAAKQFARIEGWLEIEVGAPPQPAGKEPLNFILTRALNMWGRGYT